MDDDTLRRFEAEALAASREARRELWKRLMQHCDRMPEEPATEVWLSPDEWFQQKMTPNDRRFLRSLRIEAAPEL